MAIENSVPGILGQIVRVILYLTRPLSDYVLDFVYHLIMGKTKTLPPIRDKLLLLSATELAEKIRTRQIKCEDVIRAYAERGAEIHPLVNAAVDDRYDGAIKDAKEIDKFLDRKEKSVEEIARDTPLLGVPFTCKEAIGVKDLTQTCGLMCAKGRKAKKDSDTAALYRKAGAIPLTVTTVPETCFWWESSNLVHGMTKNPYDNSRTVGGSSGGEGAIITSGAALIGIGSDFAGSIRIPASFCGIYGHKPTSGTISNFGTFPYSDMKLNEEMDSFLTTGPMCRFAEDLPLLTKILSNCDKRLKLNEKVDFRKVKIYYMEEIPSFLLKAVPSIKASVHKAVNHFKETYDIKPIPLKIDELKDGFYIWESKMLSTGVPPFEKLLAGKDEHFNLWAELLKSLFRSSNHTLPALYFAMVDRREKNDVYYDCMKKYEIIEKKFQDIFAEDAILLMPTHPEPPPHYLMTIPKYPNIGYTCIFNILGFPSTQIPTGFDRGLPIGIQAISGPLKDHLTLAAAIELDNIFGGWKSPCPIDV